MTNMQLCNLLEKHIGEDWNVSMNGDDKTFVLQIAGETHAITEHQACMMWDLSGRPCGSGQS